MGELDLVEHLILLACPSASRVLFSSQISSGDTMGDTGYNLHIKGALVFLIKPRRRLLGQV